MSPASANGARRAFVNLAVAAALCLLGVSAWAQTKAEPDAGQADKRGDLSDRLNKSNGVIKPREDVDPGMTKPAPQSDQPMPVAPPPGSPGGDPNVHPK